MLLLKGDAGKSIVVQAIGQQLNSVVFCYCDDMTNVIDAYYISPKKYDQDKFMNLVKGHVRSNRVELVIIYTNLSEQEILKLIDAANELEKEGYVRFAMVTCK